MNETKIILFTWGFNEDGEIYLDSYLEITPLKESVISAKMMDVRMNAQRTKMSLMRICKDAEREDLEQWVLSSSYDKEVMKKLKESQVRLSDLLVESRGNSIDFIRGL